MSTVSVIESCVRKTQIINLIAETKVKDIGDAGYFTDARNLAFEAGLSCSCKTKDTIKEAINKRLTDYEEQFDKHYKKNLDLRDIPNNNSIKDGTIAEIAKHIRLERVGTKTVLELDNELGKRKVSVILRKNNCGERQIVGIFRQIEFMSEFDSFGHSYTMISMDFRDIGLKFFIEYYEDKRAEHEGGEYVIKAFNDKQKYAVKDYLLKYIGNVK